MRVSLYIENTKVDLFEDETIELKSSVQDVNDITKNTTDYTRNFKVPASSNNNILFKHYYDANIDNGFDARTKINARIELDGIVFRYGKLSLLSVDMKKGKPSSYGLVFYGNLVSLKDTVKDDYLSVLDFSEFNHVYNDTNIIDGLQGNLFNGDLVYPLLVKKRYYYNSDSGDNTQTDSISNIAYNGGTTNGVKHSDLKYSIKLIRIIEAIEDYYGIEFSRDFFGRSEFTNIYMWMNAERDEDIGNFNAVIDWDGGDTTYADLANNTFTFDPFYSGTNFWNYRRFNHALTITPTDQSISYTVRTYKNNQLWLTNTLTGTQTLTTATATYGETFTSNEYTLRFEIEAPLDFIYSASITNTRIVSIDFGNSTGVDFTTTASSSTITGEVNVNLNVPKIKIIDLLKGLFQMFKLVVIQDNNTDPIYVNTLKDYYYEGEVYNLTEFTDSSQHTVERGELLNTIIYEFSEPQTILNTEFENNTGLGYGDEEAILETEDGEPLDGDSLEITLPFEQIVYERLTDLNDNNQTNIQYGAVIDEDLNPVNIDPHLHYVVFNNNSSKSLSFIGTGGTEYELNTVACPSHTITNEEPAHSLIFSAEYSTYTGAVILNTLYKNWHYDFITSIFNIKRRTFKYTVYNLPYRYLMSLRLNDVIQIKDNFYRINSFNTNLVTGKVDFELINSFDNTLNYFDTSQTIVLSSQRASQETVYVNQLSNKDYAKVNLGDGSDWITVSDSGNLLVLDVDENNTGVERFMQINVQTKDKSKTKEIIVRQLNGFVTWDNEDITFDSINVTFDNI